MKIFINVKIILSKVINGSFIMLQTNWSCRKIKSNPKRSTPFLEFWYFFFLWGLKITINGSTSQVNQPISARSVLLQAMQRVIISSTQIAPFFSISSEEWENREIIIDKKEQLKLPAWNKMPSKLYFLCTSNCITEKPPSGCIRFEWWKKQGLRWV